MLGIWIIEPARGIASLEIDEALGDRKVNQIQVERVELEIGQRSLGRRPDMFSAVVVVS